SNFVAGSTGLPTDTTWTVQSSNQVAFRFAIIGKIARVQLTLINTIVTVGSNPTSFLIVKLPFTSSAPSQTMYLSTNNATRGVSIATLTGNELWLFSPSGQWDASAGNTSIWFWGEVPLEI